MPDSITCSRYIIDFNYIENPNFICTRNKYLWILSSDNLKTNADAA